MRGVLALWLTFVPLAAGIACSHNRASTVYDPAAPVSVVVQNNNVQDIDVFAFGDGGRRRLGTVVSHSTATYFLDSGFLGSAGMVQLVAEPVASRGSAIQARVPVQPGQEVRWMLESSLARSYVSVR
jgi:hypothetical protein